MGSGSFYVTTPIYYVNDKPHIGHAYTTILADVLARYHRLLGEPCFFLTGTDEHGQKVQKAAQANNLQPKQHCDNTVVRFQELWKRLDITNDHFIRTTDDTHKEVVREVLQELYDKGLIYKSEYTGKYCVPCERFFTEKDLADGGLCPECGRPADTILESNYFFKMSQYQDWLVDHIKTHPEFIQPDFRANETLGFLKKPLGDLCISRPKSRLSWGIELPFDKDYVCYVWFDALINYISGVGYRRDDAKFGKWWPASYHLIGKDILTTHTVYWPTMLKAMGVELPRTIFAHGWWLAGQDKMSKSKGNVVNPMDMIDKCGVDAFRYFLMAEMALGQDSSFSEESFVRRYNTDLANDLGNLLSRVVKMTIAQCGGKIPSPAEEADADRELKEKVMSAVSAMEASIKNMRLDKGLEEVMAAVRESNKYLERTAPWTLAKNGDTKRLGTVLYTAAEALRIISGLLYPVMPDKMQELRIAIGLRPPDMAGKNNDQYGFSLDSLKTWGRLPVDINVGQMGATISGTLFPRLEAEPAAQAAAPEKKKETKKVDQENKTGQNVITIEDFSKVGLKTAKVLKAEKVEGADKLLKLEIEVGAETRQLVAGVALFYKPEEMVGRTIVIVSNLKPAKIRGVESQGMLLAAKKDGALKLVTVDGGDFPSGADVG